MQMVMMVFRTSLQSEVLPLVEQEQLPFTRLDGVQGKGATGGASGQFPGVVRIPFCSWPYRMND